MPLRIERLKLNSFRGATGITEIEFDVALPVCVIFGENGSGKSSIVDAIDFVCNQTLGSLVHRKLAKGKRKEPYIPSVGKAEKDVLVELTSGGTTWQARHSKVGVRGCLTPDRPKALILRRTTLLEFVESDPAERYSRLASYIAVKEIEDSEKTLREAFNSIDKELENATRAVVQAETALEDLWKAEGQPGASWREWADEEAAKDISNLEEAIGTCSSVNESAKQFGSRLEDLKTATSTEKTAGEIHELSTKNLSDAAVAFAAGSSELVTTLHSAKQFFRVDRESSRCPVCESPVDRQTLSIRIQQRIDELKKIEDLSSAVSRTGQSFRSAKTALDGSRERMLRAARLLVEKTEVSELLLPITPAIEWTSFDLLRSSTQLVIDDNAVAQAFDFANRFEAVNNSIVKRMEASTKTLHQRSSLKVHIETIKSKNADAQTLHELQRRAQRALELVVQERKRFVEVVLDAIADEVGNLYGRVHPGEAIGGLKLSLDPNLRGSLNFEGIFETEPSAPPQAYYSESHLDTLGICMFLALAKKMGPENSVVVIDDVLTSVDQTHLSRFVQLLHDEDASFNHLIITTHYRPWRDTYRYNMGPVSRVQLLELLPWTVRRGIRHTKTKLVVDELSEQLDREPLDRQLVASRAGILLEQILDHLTRLYECSMPLRSDPKYTLGEFNSGMESKLRKVLKVTRSNGAATESPEETYLKKPLDELFSLTWIRNEIGCHFNLNGHMSDADVMDFVRKVVAFANLLVCEGCGELPRSEKSGVDRKCRCGNVRLSPLQQPQ